VRSVHATARAYGTEAEIFPGMGHAIFHETGREQVVERVRGFLERHQDRIVYGSDCNDVVGRGPTCQGWLTIRTVRMLAANRQIERKILCENAKKLFNL